MSPTGHKFTAAALGIVLSVPVLEKGQALEAALVLAGVMFGARVPDWSEMARWIDGKRYSIIPHRGPTHWPGTWIAGLLLSVLYLQPPVREAAIGFFAAALLHLAMDIMTPSGIPLLHPFDKNRSITVYRSGAFIPETLLTLACWISAVLYLWLSGSNLFGALLQSYA